MIVLILDVIPVPWAAPTRSGRRCFSKRRDDKLHMSWLIRSHYNGDQLTCPIRMHITFYMPIPSSTSKKQADLMRKKLIYPTKKPDLTNLVKLTEDALELSGVISNDSIIVETTALKLYADKPQIVIQLEMMCQA